MSRKIANPAKQADGKDYLAHIAYDSVVFGFSGEKLKILLMEYRNTGLFALPGGFVGRKTNLDDAARAGLEERTGLSGIYMEQFHTFGDCSRQDASVLKKIMKANGIKAEKDHWLLDRFISVAYYALINYNAVKLQPDALSDSCDWYPVDALPQLILDHGKIVEKALQALRRNPDERIIGMKLLPEKFTMKELQQVYESILGEPLERANFQRKMIASGLLTRHAAQFTGKAHKAPYLYSFAGNKTSVF